MALRNQPYFPLYVQDYLTDEKLNECSAASQGVYIKILCVMHKSQEYGKILLKQNDKQKLSSTLEFAEKLSRHLTFSTQEIQDALSELIMEGVLQVDRENGILSQKRMIKDNDISNKRSVAGRKGGKNTQFAKDFALAKSEANSEYEYVYEDEYKDIDKNRKEKINSIWIRTFGRNPKIPEVGETQKLLNKFGEEKVYKIFKQATLDGFYKIKTLVESLDQDGNIKPKNDKPIREI